MDKKEKHDLVMSHQAFVNSIARKYAKNDNLEDLVQEGNIGLLRAAEAYDSLKETTFTTYASYWVKKYIYSYLRGEQKYETNMKSEMPAAFLDYSNGSEGEDYSIVDEEDAVVTELIKLKIYELIKDIKLTTTELDILLSRYLAGTDTTQTELGERYGITRQRIEQLEKQMLNKLKDKTR